MANKYQVVDEILKGQGQGTYNVVFTNLNITNEEDTESVEVMGAITDYVSEHLQVSYDNIEGAPALPVDTDEQSPAYQGESGAREIKGFHEVAFTGDYNDLENKIQVPADTNGTSDAYQTVDGIRILKPLNEVAFTGVTELGNVQVSEILDLSIYHQNIRSLGTVNAAVSYGEIYNLNSSPTIGNFENVISGFCNKFIQNKGKKPYYIITKAGTNGVDKPFLVLQIEKSDGGSEGTNYFKVDVVNVNTSTYTFAYGTYGTNVLNNIDITSKLGCFIFDIKNDYIYFKTKDVGSGKYEDLTGKPTLFSGNYDDLTGKPTLFSGNYDDLENQYYIFTPKDFIYRYDLSTDNWSILTGDQLTTLSSCGLVSQTSNFSAWVKNIHQLYTESSYNNQVTQNEISLLDKLEELYVQFNNGKLCYLQNNNNYYLITRIETNFNSNNTNIITDMTISCTPLNMNNFHDLLLNQNNVISNDSDIDNMATHIFGTLQQPLIYIDFNNKILYSQCNRIAPASANNSGLTILTDNSIGVNISAKANNAIQILTNTGEEGLYVGLS